MPLGLSPKRNSETINPKKTDHRLTGLLFEYFSFAKYFIPIKDYFYFTIHTETASYADGTKIIVAYNKSMVFID
jgi:hypothetical protein